MPDPYDRDSTSEADRQATRTASANRGNIRYGTRGENYSAREYGGYGNFVRNFRNQGRVMRNIYRNFRNGSR